MELSFVNEKLQEKLFKTAVKVPVYTSEIIAGNVFTEIGKFCRTSVRLGTAVTASSIAMKAPSITFFII